MVSRLQPLLLILAPILWALKVLALVLVIKVAASSAHHVATLKVHMEVRVVIVTVFVTVFVTGFVVLVVGVVAVEPALPRVVDVGAGVREHERERAAVALVVQLQHSPPGVARCRCTPSGSLCSMRRRW